MYWTASYSIEDRIKHCSSMQVIFLLHLNDDVVTWLSLGGKKMNYLVSDYESFKQDDLNQQIRNLPLEKSHCQ